MIDMRMSAENVPDVEPVLGDEWQNQFGVFTRIDEQSFTGFFTTHEVTVALQRAHGYRFENQNSSSVFKETDVSSEKHSNPRVSVPRSTFSAAVYLPAELVSI
jgi:hypothetical protein